MATPWVYPTERYYYGWYNTPPPEPPSDHDIKSNVVDHLRNNQYTKQYDIKVDVKQGVVVLGGAVGSALAKRAAGDDAWDVAGVKDVSNQLEVRD